MKQIERIVYSMHASIYFEKQVKIINQTRNQAVKQINCEANKTELIYVQSFYKNHILNRLDVNSIVECKMMRLIVQTLDILNKEYSSSASSKHVMILKLINQYKALLSNAYIEVINQQFDPQKLAKNPFESPQDRIDVDHLDEYTQLFNKFDSQLPYTQ